MTGVSWDTHTSKWFAKISFRGVDYGLIRDSVKGVAMEAYREAKSYKDSNPRTFKAVVKRIRAEHRKEVRQKYTSKYQGVCYSTDSNRWRAYCNLPGQGRVHIGSFATKRQAYVARKAFLRENGIDYDY